MNPLMTETKQILNSPIIVALDCDNEIDAMNIVSQLDPSLCKLKIGKELFTACGPKFVEKIAALGYQIFLDLKFHDIPNTVYKACKSVSNLGVWMTNVHISGGPKMLEMARLAIDESSHKPLLIGVTVLTSMDQNELSLVGIEYNLEDHAINLAKLSYRYNFSGVVCSAHESLKIKQSTNDNFLTVSPGIRLTKDITDDQARIMTPIDTIANKVDYLVIGRPITQAKSPVDTLTKILSDLHRIKNNNLFTE